MQTSYTHLLKYKKYANTYRLAISLKIFKFLKKCLHAKNLNIFPFLSRQKTIFTTHAQYNGTL